MPPIGPNEPAPGLVEYAVRGSGRFPVDMLRYGRCWPATPGDALALASVEAGERMVRVRGLGPVAPERWQSFGWAVVEGAALRPEGPR